MRARVPAMSTLLSNDPLSRANRHHGAGRLGEAETLYRSILEGEPGHAQALHGLGVLALQTGNADAAKDLITRAAKMAP